MATAIINRLTKVEPVWYGIGLIAVITLIWTAVASSYSLFILDSVLFACIGAIALQALQGTAGLFSVGNSAFLMVGAFTTVFVTRSGIGFPADVVVATVVGGIAGVIVGLPAMKLGGLFLVLSTLSAYFLVTFIGDQYQAAVPEAQNNGFYIPIEFGSFSPRDQGRYWAWLSMVLVCLCVLGASRLLRERFGRALRMMREHEHVAPIIGVPVTRYKLGLFAVTSAIISMQGALTAHLSGNVQTALFPLSLSFEYVIMIVIGGLDSILGAVLGASIVIALPIVIPHVINALKLQSTSPSFGGNVSLIVYGVAVVLVIVGSPDGLVGIGRRLGRLLTSRGASTRVGSSESTI